MAIYSFQVDIELKWTSNSSEQIAFEIIDKIPAIYPATHPSFIARYYEGFNDTRIPKGNHLIGKGRRKLPYLIDCTLWRDEF